MAWATPISQFATCGQPCPGCRPQGDPAIASLSVEQKLSASLLCAPVEPGGSYPSPKGGVDRVSMPSHTHQSNVPRLLSPSPLLADGLAPAPAPARSSQKSTSLETCMSRLGWLSLSTADTPVCPHGSKRMGFQSLGGSEALQPNIW